MKIRAMFGIGALSLGLMLVPGLARAQEHRSRDVPNPLDVVRGLQNTGRMLFMMADVNHDGLVSQKEAIDANNRAVGGFFFQADADGNGTVSQEEARAVREAYLDQNPWTRYVVEALRVQSKNAEKSNQPNPIQSFEALLDSNSDKQIQATEVRQLVQTTTQSFFAAADTNRDGQMSPSEVNAAVEGGIRALAQLGFQQADTDSNGALSRAEFDKAIIEPANVAFQILDLNHDGQISQQEAQQTQRTILGQVRMFQLSEPANSPTNVIESGRLPSETGTVPTFATPNLNRNGQSRPQPEGRQAQPR